MFFSISVRVEEQSPSKTNTSETLPSRGYEVTVFPPPIPYTPALFLTCLVNEPVETPSMNG